MKKVALLLASIILICSVYTVPVEAHQNASEHYEELEAMLFDNRNFHSSLDKDTKNKVRMLEYASTLCIDQFGDTNGTLLKVLKKWKVPDIPSKLSKINPDDNDEVKLSPTNHRTYTHQGWEYSYAGEKHGDLARWSVRKDILLASTEKVFDFSTFSGKWVFIDFGYSAKCDSFSALIYYNHLLGDYLEDVDSKTGNVNKFNGKTNGHTIPFASNSSNPVDMFSEIEKHLAILFKDQADDSRVYDSLISDIETLASKARRISGNEDGTITEDEFADMQVCVQEFMDILTGENEHYNAVHELLMNEEFFKDVFY